MMKLVKGGGGGRVEPWSTRFTKAELRKLAKSWIEVEQSSLGLIEAKLALVRASGAPNTATFAEAMVKVLTKREKEEVSRLMSSFREVAYQINADVLVTSDGEIAVKAGKLRPRRLRRVK